VIAPSSQVLEPPQNPGRFTMPIPAALNRSTNTWQLCFAALSPFLVETVVIHWSTFTRHSRFQWPDSRALQDFGLYSQPTNYTDRHLSRTARSSELNRK
ncbi:hypothetical protein, partial [Pseudomonas aeruginosa]|uniref:hypothetical protein n=1 Tax=Pseudomonas aeruginosa TaxID=287 RepID=UPI001C3F524F